MRIALLTLLGVALLASTVRAHDPSECGCTPAPSELKLRQRQEWVSYRLRARNEIRIGGPIAGVIASANLLSVGIVLVAGRESEEISGPRAITSVTTVLLSLPLAVISTTVLWKRVQKRRAILREITESAALGGFGVRF